MEFAVTGGAGFVGNNLVKLLVKEGHTVKVIDNLHNGKKENLSSVINEIEFYEEDITDFNSIEKILKDVDGVFHQAALTVVQDSFEKPELYHKVNVIGTENIFKLANRNNFKVVYASSSSVYGHQKVVPIVENAERSPINPYGETKLQDEFLFEKYKKLNTSIIGLRYFNIYGKGQNLDYAGVITKFLDRILNEKSPIIYGDGLQIRDFIYVEDIVKANLKAMMSDIKTSLTNVGSGESISIKELAEMMIKLSNKELKIIFKNPLDGDIQMSQANIDLAVRSFGWKPEMRLEEWLTTILK
jgi:UDP-glucose 4-epimerase